MTSIIPPVIRLPRSLSLLFSSLFSCYLSVTLSYNILVRYQSRLPHIHDSLSLALLLGTLPIWAIQILNIPHVDTSFFLLRKERALLRTMALRLALSNLPDASSPTPASSSPVPTFSVQSPPS